LRENYRYLAQPVLKLTSIIRKFANCNRMFFKQACETRGCRMR